MGISASRFGGSIDFDERASLIVDSTGLRNVTRHEAALQLSGEGRHGYWATAARRGIVDAWLLHELRNGEGTAGLSLITATDVNMTADVVEHGLTYIPLNAPPAGIRIPIDLGTTALFDDGPLYAAVKVTISGEAEIGLTMAFLSRRRA